MAVTTAVGVSVLLVIFIYLFAPVVTAVFNGEHNRTLADYAETGLRKSIFRKDGSIGLNFTVHFSERKWIQQIRMPTTGESAVASAAPSMESPSGNIST